MGKGKGAFYLSRHDFEGNSFFERCNCGGKLLLRIGLEEKGFEFHMVSVFCESCHIETGSCWDNEHALTRFRNIEKFGV